VRPRRGRAS